MYFTGFADEAASDIDGQIRATKELGWENIESRAIGGTNIHDITDAEFDAVCGRLEDAGVKINCFGSTIANWGKQVNEPFDVSLAEARRAIPRMKRLGSPLVRIMSFAVLKNEDGSDAADQMAEERFRRLRELVAMFQGEGIQVVHENCMNYGGMSAGHSLELLENVPGLKLVYDTGNPVFTFDRSKPAPHPKQSPWEFYSQVKDHIAYVHIKDAKYVGEVKDGLFPDAEYSYPGDGDGDVKRVVGDLLASGYDGGFSMEPHLSVVFHDASVEANEQAKYDSYVEYGRRFMQLVEEVKPR